jgi:predicted permease
MFTAVTLLTLAIGIGATTAVFSVVNGVLLKPLPYARPDELIAIKHAAPGLKIPELPVSPACYVIYREHSTAFQDVALWTGDTMNVTGLSEPEQVDGLDVSDGLLPTLGVQPILGRGFTRHDDTPGSPKTAILSYGYWQRKFAGDRGVLGKTIQIDSEQREIIGVLPDKFSLDNRTPAILIPFQFERGKMHLGNFSYSGLARLKPGVTMAQASADIVRMIPIMMDSFPPPPGASRSMFEGARMVPNLRPLKEDVIGDVGSLLWVIMGVIGIVLLIACANVANLLLVRAEGRQQELAVRAALGASWGRIAGELLLESVTLGIAGGVLGAAVAYGGVQALVAAAPTGLPRLNEIAIDGTVLLFALAVSVICGGLFGLIPVFKYAGPQLAMAIRHGGRTLSQSRERHRARSTLVVVQVALAMVLLVGSGLMIRTFQAMRKIQPGFTRPEQVQTIAVSIPETQVKGEEQMLRMMDEIRQKIAALPGVQSVGFGAGVPMSGQNSFDPVDVQDHPTAAGKLATIRRYKWVSPEFEATLGNSLLAGRYFTWNDIYTYKPVALLSENVAKEYWGSAAGAVGKLIREGPAGPWREVVGVVGDERDDGVDKKESTTVYWPILVKKFWGQEYQTRRNVRYVVRSTRTGSEGFVSELRQAVWSVNPNVPIAGVRTLGEMYERSMARTSFALVMLAAAGSMALLLGLIGIYGVISYSVSHRRREIGIRMALGAQQPTLTRMFIGYGLRLAAIGLACGLGAAFALTRAMKSLLFGISAADPATYAAVAVMLAAAAALAAYLPSRRATAVDPVEALRAE